MMTKCTICAREFGEKNDVALYPIWGVMDGFYDARLPKAFFQVPPIKFDKIYIESSGQGREPSRREREANEHAREALRVSLLYTWALITRRYLTSACSSSLSLSLAMLRAFGVNSQRLRTNSESTSISFRLAKKKI